MMEPWLLFLRTESLPLSYPTPGSCKTSSYPELCMESTFLCLPGLSGEFPFYKPPPSSDVLMKNSFLLLLLLMFSVKMAFEFRFTQRHPTRQGCQQLKLCCAKKARLLVLLRYPSNAYYPFLMPSYGIGVSVASHCSLPIPIHTLLYLVACIPMKMGH